MVAAAAESLRLVAVGGGEVDFGSGVGGDKDVPFEAVAFAFPLAFDEAADGTVGAVHMVEAFDGRGYQHDFAVAGSQRSYSTEVFVVPDDEVAEEHDMVA